MLHGEINAYQIWRNALNNLSFSFRESALDSCRFVNMSVSLPVRVLLCTVLFSAECHDRSEKKRTFLSN